VKISRIAAALAVLALAIAVVYWLKRAPQVTTRPSSQARYVGAASCRECHAGEYDAWTRSHHRRAMEAAGDASVAGDFNGASFRYGKVVSTFFRRGGKYFVRTDAATGAVEDFEIKYTFGVTPLQQYLIELPGGRLQALSIAWDARPKTAGGQRWFHLYPGDGVDHTDELHWTGRQQNWNFMCADCHSTNLRKGYDAAADRFATTWSELDVACEACHGPGSEHAATRGTASLSVRFDERKNITWIVDPQTLVPRRSAPRATSVEIDVCARCHSRREQIAEGYTPGAPLEDFYAPSLLMPGLYHDDGRQLDEVYTYGSFVQSRMAHAGVTCADCHEPHSQTLRADGNALCAHCHAPAKYDAPSHHHAAPHSAAAQCVACHMPATTYMQIDPRRDHSIRVPRLDRWISLGGPPDSLRALAGDTSRPPIVRASALARLANAPDAATLDAVARHAADASPLVRRGALQALESFAPEMRRAIAWPLLRDGVRSVRVQAAWVLAPVGGNDPDFTRAAEEFIASRRYRADRPEDRTTLGTFFANLGRQAEAMAEYRAALTLAPRYTPAYINLSDLQRASGNEAAAEATLRDGLARVPGEALLHHALGLSLARSRKEAEALAELRRASELSTDARFAYAYAVALHGAGRVADAIALLEKVHAREPRDRDVLFALATFHRDAGRAARALEYAARLARTYPEDPEARALLESLRIQRGSR
jgi:tetratricopeptide (TPR) repeat protein